MNQLWAWNNAYIFINKNSMKMSWVCVKMNHRFAGIIPPSDQRHHLYPNFHENSQRHHSSLAITHNGVTIVITSWKWSKNSSTQFYLCSVNVRQALVHLCATMFDIRYRAVNTFWTGVCVFFFIPLLLSLDFESWTLSSLGSILGQCAKY